MCLIHTEIKVLLRAPKYPKLHKVPLVSSKEDPSAKRVDQIESKEANIQSIKAVVK